MMMDKLHDRIERGDEVVQGGKTYMRQMSGKDLMLGIRFDHRLLKRDVGQGRSQDA